MLLFWRTLLGAVMGDGVSGLDFHDSILLNIGHTGVGQDLDTADTLEPGLLLNPPLNAQENAGDIAICGLYGGSGKVRWPISRRAWSW